MKNFSSCFAAVLLAACFGLQAFGQETAAQETAETATHETATHETAAADKAEGHAEGKCCGKCKDGGECCGKCKDGGDCPITKAMSALPQMTFKVGDEETCCAETAAGMVKENGGHIHYVVAKKEFDSKQDAMVLLAEETEKFVDSFATPHTCSVSGKTSVCGKSMSCSESATKMASVAKDAMKTIAMTYQVGDETCSCPNQAAAIAKKTGAKKEFLVDGDSTCCEAEARVKLARAKYRAAIEAIANADADADSDDDNDKVATQS